jgi:hypothetical protein
MLANPVLATGVPPRVVVDATNFKNESTSRFSTNMIVDRLRNELVRSAHGRMRFLSRETLRTVSTERAAKRAGKFDAGSRGMTKAPAGADYKLRGRITENDSMRLSNGLSSKHHYFHFEMVDQETDEIVWSNAYEFKKTAQDDVVYRGAR